MVPVTALWYRLRLRFKHMRVGRDTVTKAPLSRCEIHALFLSRPALHSDLIFGSGFEKPNSQCRI
jgi:hypothetical protein